MDAAPSSTVFRLIHISDPHFSHGSVQTTPSLSHSIPHLVALEQHIRAQPFDRLIVSGDLSNRGDPESLNQASEWLFNSFGIGANQRTGLELPRDKAIIVPGNHDAYNCTDAGGSWTDNWQKSLAHYNYIFPTHSVEDAEGCRYYWLPRGNEALFIVAVSSCHLNDPALETEFDIKNQLITRMSKVARGRLSIRQSERVLKWFDDGRRGRLRAAPLDSTNEERIPAARFAASFKVLVMHHYLFEPSGHKSSFFLKMEQKATVFRNIAMADFDILLCGHKHIPEATQKAYGAYFTDARARGRYMINLFRRLVGISQLPATDRQRHRLTKAFTDLIGLFLSQNGRRKDESLDAYTERLLDAFRRVLQDPDSWRDHLHQFEGTWDTDDAIDLSSREVNEIVGRIRDDLTRDERLALNDIAEDIRRTVRNLGARPFVQLMCGSSAKSSKTGASRRAFSIYDIAIDDGSAVLTQHEYTWDTGGSSFSPPLVSQFVFPRDRRSIV